MRPFETMTALSESRPWFLSLVHQLAELWREERNPPAPIELTAVPIEVPEVWSRHQAGVPRLLSVLVHAALAAALMLFPWAPARKQIPKGVINIALYAPQRLILPAPDESRGGGGGGRHQPAPPSKGKLPRAADRQFVPPDPEPSKAVDPTLIVEPSIVAPQLALLPQLNLLNIGDPDGIPGPPSSGPGNGNGIGTGNDHGIGPDRGPGVGPGGNFGYTSPPFHIGGEVSRPVLLTQIIPEYSDEARKARFQGRVILDTIVREDGSVQVVRVARGIGFGLDEKAIAAVLQWRFQPARMNGKPVAVALNVEVNFNLR